MVWDEGGHESSDSARVVGSQIWSGYEGQDVQIENGDVTKGATGACLVMIWL